MAAVPGRPNPWPTLGKLVLALVATGVIAAGMLMPVVLGSGLVGKNYSSKFLETACNLQETKPPQPTTLFARDRKTVIARLFTQDRTLVSLDQIPKYLPDALIATEDRRFYSHHGVDLRGLMRSAISTTSGDTQGGSTLTMQYVKQIRYYQAGDDPKMQQAAIAQTIKRKMEDAKCALDFEGPRHETKRDILDNYLNIAFFGEHAYGIQKAAETYFNKPASRLTLAQSSLLVGMLRAPSAYDPFVHPAAAKQRRNEVLQNLVNVGKLSQQIADQQKATAIALATTRPPLVKQGCANANSTLRNAAFFCDYAVRWLRTSGGLSETQLQTGGLKVITTLDPTLQNSAQANIAKAIPATSPMTAVLPGVDPRTGDVLMMATSKKYGSKKGETEQPLFTSYTVGGASTFKLFPLLTALDTGVPTSWPLTTTGNQGSYTPKQCVTRNKVVNGDEKVSYNATERLDSATAKSSNTYFVGLADQLLGCKLEPVVNLMSELGMKGMQQPSDTQNQTWAQVIVAKQRAQQLVLGSVPTSALELAGAYAAVANGGRYNTPAPILSITDGTGAKVAVKRTPGVQAVSAEAAANAVQVLIGETKGVGSAASRFTDWYNQNSSDIAGKTGTNPADTKNNSSIWFVGMTPQLVASSGLINFDSSSTPSTGLPGEKKGKAYGDYAAKVWLRSLKPALDNQSWTWQPPELVPGDLVPDVSGKDLTAAKKRLAKAGYKVSVLGAGTGLLCASNVSPYSIAFYGPSRAVKGSTITVCESSGAGQTYNIPRPPPVQNPRSNHNRSGRNRTGSTRTQPPGGRSSSSSPPGHRRNGHGGGGH